MAAIIVGLILLGVAWLQWPSFERRPGDCLRREEYPNLFALVDEVAAVLAIRAEILLRANYDYNARLSEVTWRRTPVVTLGMGLWKVAGPQERIALIAHELAHRANGDPVRRQVVWIALNVLDEWEKLLGQDPDSIGGEHYGGIVKMVMALLAGIVRLVRRTIVQFLYLDSQRAEYFADFLAARVAGTDATLALLRKNRFSESLKSFLFERVSLSDATRTGVYTLFRSFVETMPRNEDERLVRCQMSETSQIDSTHPPTLFRIRFLMAHPLEPGIVFRSPAEWEEIDQEIVPLELALSDSLMAHYFGER
ncbi:MAG: M48 family metallopeptidase [Hyphomicrobiales bacterium]